MTVPEVKGQLVRSPPDTVKEAGARRIVGWSLALPNGWWHIHLDGRRAAEANRLLDHFFAAMPRDQVFQLRRELGLQIDQLLDDARGNGSTDAYLLADLRYGLPLAATCLATPLDHPLPEGLPAQGLALLLARDGDETGVLTIDGTDCAAILRRTPATRHLPSDDAEIPLDTALEDSLAFLSVTRLDVYVPFPDRASTLLLTFTTPIEPVAAELTLLFEAIAGSLRWRWE